MKPIQIEIDGVSHTFREWAEVSGIDEYIIRNRYYRFFKSGKDLIAPVKKKTAVKITVNGKAYTFQELSEMTGIDEGTLKCRYYRGHKNLIAAVRKRESVLLLTINGETHTGISQKNIRNRYYQGKSGAELIAPLKFEKDMEIEINGELHTLREWSEITGISVCALRYRYNRGATAAEFLKPPKNRKDD